VREKIGVLEYEGATRTWEKNAKWKASTVSLNKSRNFHGKRVQPKAHKSAASSPARTSKPKDNPTPDALLPYSRMIHSLVIRNLAKPYTENDDLPNRKLPPTYEE
jgi:hypothetical protein